MMGYAGAAPDAEMAKETEALLSEMAVWLRPRFAFMVRYGNLNTEESVLTIPPVKNATPAHETTSFQLRSIITRQLKGAEAFAFFVATAGVEFEDFQQQLMTEGDMVKVYIANAVGSVIAERCADLMEETLQQSIDKLGWKHTNRFSPGYCDWHVSEQQKLFPLFGTTDPCGIHLTPSSMMIPIKSVSGVIGVGKTVSKHDYACGLCDFDKCFRKRVKNKK